MLYRRRTLSGDVLAAFERACREDDLAVAEHLLAALETIARREETSETLQQVYLELVHVLRSQALR
ncbi:hypothetical protein [Herbaspirillum sp. ST 5-3]|uniref:hypothetical protein n=1 Tax=Oxalobacteraceae TaxID=75682 RepID=UPI0010A39746|nr:hypothetical protein [Herbaspirillum sp. ST 5-3]